MGKEMLGSRVHISVQHPSPRRTQLVSRRTLGPVLMLVAASLDEWLALSLVRLGVSVTRAKGFFL
jgi:hypothetical protein